MSLFIKVYEINIRNAVRTPRNSIFRLYSTIDSGKDNGEEEFRVLDLMKKKSRIPRRVIKREDLPPPRSEQMPPTQNWGNVWPGPRSFHPATVPLPMRQGYVSKGEAPPGKFANAELMKVPNFLHLTPPVIRRQCEALKQFCTEWPKGLNSDEQIVKHYPIEVITSDYCHASPSIRNPLARIVSIRIKLSTLNLNSRAKDKFLRLVGQRYDRDTDNITFVADRCPTRKQNLDYAMYLLTACFHESWNVEAWESEKSEADMEYYDWDRNSSRRSVINLFLRTKGESREMSDEDYKSFDVEQIPNVAGYRTATTELLNNGEDEMGLTKYRRAVQQLLGLPEFKADTEARDAISYK